MSGPTLLGLVGPRDHRRQAKPQRAQAVRRSMTLPDGGAGLTVDDATKQRAVDRLMKG